MRVRIRAVVTPLVVACCCTISSFGQSFVNFETPHVSPIALSPDRASLFVVNTADNRLEIFDLSSGVPVGSASVAVGLDPVSVRARTNNEVWVVNHLSDSISIVDVGTARVVRTLATEDEPTDLVFAGGRAFVTISQRNQVWVYRTANLDLPPRKLPIVGEEPRALAVSPDGSQVVAAIFESGNNSTVLEPNSVNDPAGPYAGMNPPPNDGPGFWPPLNPANPPGPGEGLIVKKSSQTGLWLDANGADWSDFVTWDLHDHDLAVIDASSLAVSYVAGLMNINAAVAFRPDGLVTVVGSDATNEVRFEPNLTGRFVHILGAAVNLSTNQRTLVDLNPHLADEYANGIGTIPPQERVESIADPRGIVWWPDGSRAYVTGLGSNNVVVIDSAGNRLARIPVGEGPTGIVADPVRNQLYVVNKFGGSVSVIDAGSQTETARVAYFGPTPPAIRDGRKFQYDAHLTSGLGITACASCHIDSRMDQLAWDLGDPAGELKAFNQDCQTELGADCEDWHPLKGPMTTQTLQGIIGHEPLHWRADREGLSAFSPAFVGLLGREAELTTEEMAAYEAFIASIQYQPNPHRTFQDGLPTRLMGGNPAKGEFIYKERQIDNPLACNDCHLIETGGSSGRLTPGDAMGSPQSMKIAQLRNAYEKIGADRHSLTANKGFGFTHAGVDVDLVDFLSRHVFVFPRDPLGDKMRRDLQAFVMCFPTGTHPGVGEQVFLDGVHFDIDMLHKLESFENMADLGKVGFVFKGRMNGENRGGVYLGNHVFMLDRAADPLTTTEELVLNSGVGSEMNLMLVPAGSQWRIGVDRDEDGLPDGDE